MRVSLVLLVLATLLWLATSLAARPFPPPAPAASPLAPGCLQELAARLTRAGLVGQASGWAGGDLTVEVAPPAGRPPEQAAQVIWDVFDAVAALPPACPYQRLEVRVPTSEGLLLAQVAAADLRAWAEAALDDAALIERVSYTRQPLPPSGP